MWSHYIKIFVYFFLRFGQYDWILHNNAFHDLRRKPIILTQNLLDEQNALILFFVFFLVKNDSGFVFDNVLQFLYIKSKFLFQLIFGCEYHWYILFQEPSWKITRLYFTIPLCHFSIYLSLWDIHRNLLLLNYFFILRFNHLMLNLFSWKCSELVHIHQFGLVLIYHSVVEKLSILCKQSSPYLISHNHIF